MKRNAHLWRATGWGAMEEGEEILAQARCDLKHFAPRGIFDRRLIEASTLMKAVYDRPTKTEQD